MNDMVESAPPSSAFVWVGVHPADKVRLVARAQRIVRTWHSPEWLEYRLREAGCEARFSGWTGAVELRGLIRLQPGHAIDELTFLDAEEELLYECPQASYLKAGSSR